EDAAIRRPRPSPIGINAETGWVFRSAALHHGAGFGPRSAVEPVSRERCAVVLEPGKARELLAGLDGNVRLRIGDVGERFAVVFFAAPGLGGFVGVFLG